MKPFAIALIGLTAVPAMSSAQSAGGAETGTANAIAAPVSLAPSTLPVGTTPPNPAFSPSEARNREREASRPRFRYLPLLTAGAAVFLASYAPAAIGATLCVRGDSVCGPNAGWLYLPLLGPFVAASDAISTANTLWMVDGFCQFIGFAAMMVGLRPSERHWVTPQLRVGQSRPHRALEISRWSAAPSVSPNFAGMTLVVENF